jgi:hypothetical protein
MIGKNHLGKETTKKEADNNQHGWSEARTERIYDKGEYVANYKKWKNNLMIIQELSEQNIRYWGTNQRL